MDNTITQIQYFDTIRDNLLASLYTRDYQSFDQTFTKLAQAIKPNTALSENAQKTLYQINLIVKKFNKKDADNYLSKFLKTRARLETKSQTMVDYETWKTNLGLDKQTLKILFATTINFQLSTGCSNHCKRCNEWALPGVRKHFSYNAVMQIAHSLAKENNKDYALYSASDPLDWNDWDKDITHVMDALSKEDLMPVFGLLTKIPKGKETLFKQLIQKNADISASITSLNRERINRLENQLSKNIHKQHDTDDLLIPAGNDEDFYSIKSSITDSYGTEITPDGAFIVAPTFTSALNLTGQKRIPITKSTEFFIKKMVGTKGLKFDYFENLKVINKQNTQYALKFLLDSQIENLLLDNGDYDVTQPGMISLKEYFETFKPEAVNKRKNMLFSVKKRLKAQYPGSVYTNKLKNYENLCDQNHVTSLKHKAVKNFLTSIKRYLKKYNTKRIIICQLRKKEMDLFNQNLTKPAFKVEIESILKQHDADTFQLFTQLVFILLENPDHPLVTDFLHC
ncbi:MAG: hypothetical protein KAJ62_07515 [Desulfobacteraceae bacterium]|nr:hypothetical protein [Desulfobacteraceae bacterium]